MRSGKDAMKQNRLLSINAFVDGVRAASADARGDMVAGAITSAGQLEGLAAGVERPSRQRVSRYREVTRTTVWTFADVARAGA
jgi:hypothetical protein